MLVDYYATKLGMTQVWDKSGKRIPATLLKVEEMMVVDVKETDSNKRILEVGVGKKKLKNAKKPLRERLKKSGFSFAPLKIRGVYPEDETALDSVKPGSFISFDQVMSVGQVVDVQGVTKGRGFAGGMKRHGFRGGPKTHGQSDRARAVGSIGAGTTPGRVLKGKKMPGHYGVETKTVKGLTILAYNPETKEILVSGPVPGHIKSIVRLRKTGRTKEVELIEESLANIHFLTEKKESQAKQQEADGQSAADKQQTATNTQDVKKESQPEEEVKQSETKQPKETKA